MDGQVPSVQPNGTFLPNYPAPTFQQAMPTAMYFIGGGTGAPLQLAINRAALPVEGENGALQFQASSAGSKFQFLRLRISSGFLANPVNLHGVMWNGRFQIRPTDFVPPRAGKYHAEFEVTLFDAAGMTLIVLRASEIMEIKAKATSINIGGDLINAGNMNAMASLGSSGNDWQVINLQPDAAVSQRVQSFREIAKSTYWPPAAPCPRDSAHGTLQFQRQGDQETVVLHWSDRMGIGRGEKANVNIPLAPIPYNRDQHARLSRLHCEVTLSQGMAWITHLGANPTRQNGVLLEKNAPTQLHDGDVINIADIILLQSTIYAADEGVWAVLLERLGMGSSCVKYVLCSGTRRFPIIPQNTTLQALGVDPNAEVEFWLGLVGSPAIPVYTEKTGQNIPLDQARTIQGERAKFSWKPLSPSCEQSPGNFRTQRFYLEKPS